MVISTCPLRWCQRYLIDEPIIFSPRTLTSPPIVIGAIQNTLTPGPGPGPGPGGLFDLPTQADETAMYNSWGWVHTANDRLTTFNPTPTAYTSLIDNINRKIHNDTEADDLWNHYQMYKRTKDGNPTAAAIYLAWAQTWRDYFCDATTGYLDDWVNLGNP